MKKKSKPIEFMTRKGYQQLVKVARAFAVALTGDSGFARPDINRIALESMLIGWITTRPRWKEYGAYCKKEFPRTDLYVMAQDQAVQAAQDAISEEKLLRYFYTVRELNQMMAESPAQLKFKLAAKIAAAKERLGIEI